MAGRHQEADRTLRPGTWGWIALWAGVAIFDGWLIRRQRRERLNGGDPERWASMSTVFGDAVRHPRRGWLLILAWGTLTLHLFSVLLPERVRRIARRVDPLGAIARWLGE